MLLMERGNGAGEDGRLSYVNVLHEGGLSFARQKFQISVMKSMIPRTESVSEKMVRTAKAATAVHKLDKQRRESEGQMQDGMGGLELKAADSEFYGSDPEKGYHGDCADGASTPIAVKSKSASGEHGKVMPMDRQQMPANVAEMSGDEEAEDGCDDGSGGDPRIARGRHDRNGCAALCRSVVRQTEETSRPLGVSTGEDDGRSGPIRSQGRR